MSKSVIWIFIFWIFGFPCCGFSSARFGDPKKLLSEFEKKDIKIFNVENIPGVTGIKFSLEYPEDWVVGRVEAVPYFKNSYLVNIGASDKKRKEWMQITWTELSALHGKTVSEKILKEKFSVEKMKSEIKKDEKLIDVKSLRVKGLPAGIVETVRIHRLLNGALLWDQRRTINFWVGPTDLSISLLAIGSNEEELASHMANMRPVFEKIIASINLPDIDSYKTVSGLEFVFNAFKDSHYLFFLFFVLSFSFCLYFFYRRFFGKK